MSGICSTRVVKLIFLATQGRFAFAPGHFAALPLKAPAVLALGRHVTCSHDDKSPVAAGSSYKVPASLTFRQPSTLQASSHARGSSAFAAHNATGAPAISVPFALDRGR